jgi:hypothetical protein
MFEHLDHPQPPDVADDGPEQAEVAASASRLRLRRGMLVSTITLSLVATGGVSGLALGGPDAVHRPIGTGPLLVIGAPQSTAPVSPASLTSSERTSPNACPSLADAGRPTSSAAVAVAVTDAVVVNPDNGDRSGWRGSHYPTTPTYRFPSGASSYASATAPGGHSTAPSTRGGSGSTGGSSGSGSKPVVVPEVPPIPPVGGGGGTIPPPTDTGPGGTQNPGGDTGSGTESPGPVDPTESANPVVDAVLGALTP